MYSLLGNIQFEKDDQYILYDLHKVTTFDEMYNRLKQEARRRNYLDVKINQGRKANISNSRTNSRNKQDKTYDEKPDKTPKTMNKSETRVKHVASLKEDDLSSQPDEVTVYANYINRDKNSFDSYFIPTPMFKLVADVVGDDMVEKIVKARKADRFGVCN